MLMVNQTNFYEGLGNIPVAFRDDDSFILDSS